MLPALHPLVGRQAVLDEMELPPGLEDAPHLGQRGGDSGIVHIVHVDRACRSCRQGTAATGLKAGSLTGTAPPQPLLRQLPAHVGRLDRGTLLTLAG